MNTGRIVGLVRQAIGLFDAARREQVVGHERRRRVREHHLDPRQDVTEAGARSPDPAGRVSDRQDAPSRHRVVADRPARRVGTRHDQPTGPRSADSELRRRSHRVLAVARRRRRSRRGRVDLGAVRGRPVAGQGPAGDDLRSPWSTGWSGWRSPRSGTTTSRRSPSAPDRGTARGAPSYAKLERILDVDPAQVRREGAVLPQDRFDDVVRALRQSARSRRTTHAEHRPRGRTATVGRRDTVPAIERVGSTTAGVRRLRPR